MLDSGNGTGQLSVIFIISVSLSMIDLQLLVSLISHELLQVLQILLIVEQLFSKRSRLIVVNDALSFCSICFPVEEIGTHSVVCLCDHSIKLLFHAPVI